MNLLLFSRSELGSDGLLSVDDGRLQHLLEVHGKEVGDTVRIGEINGRMGHGKVLSINTEVAVLEPTLDQLPPAKLPLILVLALPRPKMLRRILRAVAEFGVAELHLINSLRVEKSFWQTPVLDPDTIREYLLQGLEQSRDTVLPPVSCHRRFKPFVEDLLPDLVRGRQSLLAHPGNYPPCPRSIDSGTLLVVGPEGGFIPYEVAKLEAAGCKTVSLGPRILRVENAVTSLLGRLL
ncbi:16S rRNA (uracil(1498)-N(3))-methyltransferase [Halioglobus sp. HI00S01]|uniref:16S rRNA (uracil(1498)-N(3))-methyltransferase n=1 Tax=Halioglobus sp. HI00S01 TaxID=1822214 RepID=UPI0007C27B12|nr:16S rRNA (uracil(1498)-N(3))-methyltransferase [Halioglobus sp. HI00S01]KZX59432.1 16S rRNA (uracil(1498)-N(3))-methyltransferase [Halioglobus sp. HI00S01]